MQFCFVTNNAHKLSEVMSIVGNKIQLLSLHDIGFDSEIEETKDTLEGNAYLKAQTIWNKTKLPCFADDTGLEVDALSGAPGVYSARYAGHPTNTKKNINLLLENLKGNKDRNAQFRTVISLIIPQGDYFFEGAVKGKILKARQGQNGFGYDSIFIPNGFNKSLAEMSSIEKNSISHRAIAFKKLMIFLTNTF